MRLCGWQKVNGWLVAAAVASAATVSWAGVHDGGVGSCNTCHIMHGDPGAGVGDGLLLAGSSSDVCLNCHAADYGEVLGVDHLAPPPERGPGNFVFLLADNINDSPDGATNPISGDAAGHNLLAPGHGLATDGTRLTSPGGSYPASELRCTSCHDPHGNSNYRFLRGPGNDEGSGGTFVYPPPLAEGLDLLVGGVEANGNHVAYQSGMSRWCGNCHGGYLDRHNRMGSSFRHPIDRNLSTRTSSRYNEYNGTADPTGGSAATAYLAAVPFEVVDNTVNRTAGANTSSRVMCLTCHRAHATSAPAAGRWDFNVAALGDDGVVSGSYPLPNPYPDPNQTSLCGKCHSGGMHTSTATPTSD